MHRSFPNVLPVANKYLEHKNFLKAQAEHEKNIKNAKGVVNSSEPTPRPHCTQRLRQKQIREYELAMIEQENERLKKRITKNGASVDSRHSNPPLPSNFNRRQRERQQTEHEMTLQRLKKLLSQSRSSYSKRDFDEDYAKKQDIQRRMSRFSDPKK